MPKLSIVATGTSLTAVGGWLDALQTRLAERLDCEVSIAPCALSGANSLWGLSVTSRAAADRPDVALIEFSINDASLLRGMSIEASTRNLKAIVEAFRGARADVWISLMAMNPAFGPPGWIRSRLNAYYNRDRTLAKELGIGFIDHRPAWKSKGAAELRQRFPMVGIQRRPPRHECCRRSSRCDRDVAGFP